MAVSVVSAFLQLWIMLLWTLVYNSLLRTPLSILLYIYPEVDLLDHTVSLYLIFWELPYYFPQRLHHFYLSTSNSRAFSPHILSNTCHFLFSFTTTILMRVKRDLLVLICVFPWRAEHLFTWHSYAFCSDLCIQVLVHFLVESFVSCFWALGGRCILGINYQIRDKWVLSVTWTEKTTECINATWKGW